MTAGLRLSLLQRPDGARDVFALAPLISIGRALSQASRSACNAPPGYVQQGLLPALERNGLSSSPLALNPASHTV